MVQANSLSLPGVSLSVANAMVLSMGLSEILSSMADSQFMLL